MHQHSKYWKSSFLRSEPGGKPVRSEINSGSNSRAVRLIQIPAFEYSAVLNHLVKLSEVQFPQRANSTQSHGVAERGGKLYAAKLTYFIANIAKATSSLGGVR